MSKCLHKSPKGCRITFLLFSAHVRVARTPEWLSISQPADIRYVFPQISPFDPWPPPPPWRGRKPENSSNPAPPLFTSCICALFCLGAHTHLCCLSTAKLISSLSPTDQIPSAHCKRVRKAGRADPRHKGNREWLTLQSKEGQIPWWPGWLSSRLLATQGEEADEDIRSRWMSKGKGKHCFLFFGFFSYHSVTQYILNNCTENRNNNRLLSPKCQMNISALLEKDGSRINTGSVSN